MRILLVAITMTLAYTGLLAQDEDYFMDRFNQAKGLLSEGETSTSLPILHDLHKMAPSNSNINYLLGVCYTEEDEVTDRSIYHLERAIKDVVTDYDPSSYKERHTPIFVYYFLVVAYSQNSLCEKAREAYTYFRTIYGVEKHDFYIKDAKAWTKRCSDKDEVVVLEGRKAIPTIEVEERPLLPQQEVILTKTVEYTTRSPLWGVQVAALSKLAPIYDLENLKNVEAFMDHKGLIRYVIGNFSIRKQSESLLRAVKEAGYADAFIVDVNKEKRYTKEVISVNNKSIKKREIIRERMDYKVQIGAFRDSIPGFLARKYLEVDGIEELSQQDLIILTSGKFTRYDEALAYRKELLEIGIPGAFVVAFKDGEKVSTRRIVN